MKERLQKLISTAGIASRRKAEEWIAAGRVTVNGVPAVLGQSADPATDRILVNGKELADANERVYLMLNKPLGYVTTLSDEKGRPTVAALVAGCGARVYPVGRLDLNSDGLLLMTNDGALANAVMHPHAEVKKTYRTVVSGDLAAALPLLRAPTVLDDGYRIRPAEVDAVSDDTLDITIHEGRNRQVRKMCALAGLKVRRLTRIAEGPLRLGMLPPGKWRMLTAEELCALKEAVAYEELER